MEDFLDVDWLCPMVDMDQFLHMTKVSLQRVGGLGDLFVLLVGKEILFVTQQT